MATRGEAIAIGQRGHVRVGGMLVINYVGEYTLFRGNVTECTQGLKLDALCLL